MAAEGFRLVIPQEMLNRLTIADEKLEKLGRTSEATQQKIVASFRGMTDGIQPFIDKISQAQQQLSLLSQFRGGNINLGNVSVQATQNADAINKLVDSLVRLTQENIKLKSSFGGLTDAQLGKLETKQKALNYRQEQNAIRELVNAEKERERQLIRNDKINQRIHTAKMALINAEIKDINRLSRAYSQIPRALSTKDAGRLIARSVKSDKSINQSLTAIKNLEKAKRDLDTTDKRYAQTLAKIDSEINRHRENLRRLGVETDRVRRHQSNLMNHAQQLRRSLALVFSVSQITGYINKLIQVRGEFELQQRSLRAILQDRDAADKIWQQTVDLAVRSPFRVKELVTYTKQLAAYRVETEKLHETTRMLSDVSAGLGVDMQRLILAFGQVKAANYLRGTELRQFSEAGINILGELAKYFTELEGRAVSVGEVFERVSRRMVAFSDVEEIFKRITSEGGIFYRMQELQSETVKGLISNLYDQIDLMFNEIGKSNDGILKDSIGLIKTLVENWEVLAEALKGAVAAFALYKLNTLLAKESTMLLAIDMGVLTDASQKQLKITQLLTLGWKRVTAAVKTFSKALVSNPWILAITALIYTVSKLYNAWSEHQQQLDEITKQYKELRKEVSGISVNFTYAKDINEQKKELNKIINLAKEKYNIDVDINVNDLDETKVKEQFNIIRNEVLDTMAFIERMKKAIANSDSWWKWGDDIYESFEKYGSSAQTLSNTFRDELDSLVDYLTKTGQLTDEFKEAFRDRDIYESELDYIERISKAYDKYLKSFSVSSYSLSVFNAGAAKLKKLWGEDLFNSIRTTADAITDFRDKQQKATKQFDEFADDVENKIKNIPEEKRTLWVKTLIDQESLDDFSRTLWYRLANEKFSVNIEIAPPKPAEVTGWKKEYNDYIAKLPKSSEGKSWLNDLSMESDVDIYTNNLKSNYERIDKITASWYAGNQRALHEYTKEQIIELEKQSKVLKQGYDWLVYTPTKKTNAGGRDIFTDKLRVIKEIYQAYKDLGKTLDEVGAKEGAMQKFGNAFKEAFGKTPEQMGFDLFSEEGVKKAYDYLIKNAPNAKKKIQAELAKGEIVLETKVRLQQEEDKKFADQIADMFSGYELSLELQKLNIPPDLAQQLFGVETFDLSQIREKLEKEIADAEKQGGREDFVVERKKELEKVEEMERKAQEERLKTYSKYLVKGMDERVRIKLEELRKLEEVEKDKDVYTDEQRIGIRKSIQKEAQEALDKNAWEEFKKSDIYISLFEDLNKASNQSLETMIDRLNSLRNSLSELPATQLKEIVTQLEKAKNELDERNPFKKFANDINLFFGNIGSKGNAESGIKELGEQLKIQSGLIEQQEDVVAMYERKLESGQEMTDEEKLQLENARAYLRILKNQKTTLESQQTTFQKVLDDIKKGAVGIGDAFVDSGKFIQEVGSFVDDISGKWESAFGLSDTAKADLEMISGIAKGLGETLSSVGQGIMTGDWLSAGMGAVSGIMSIASTLGQAHDKRKERQIESEIKLVERLKDLYEDLGKTIENAYSLDTLNEATAMSKENIIAQINATERMISAEKDKKKTDNDRIDEWKKNIEELKDTYRELEETRLQELGAFASEENKKSSAEAFVDAWIQAYKETGDGLIGLNEQFDEFFEDMVKKQLLQRGTQKYLDDFFTKFDKTVDEISNGTKAPQQGISEILSEWQSTSPELNSFLEKLAEALGVAGEIAESTSGLGGLQAGISGITEEQADVLAAYWSSVRLYTADTNAKVNELVSKLVGDEVDSNPILSELRAQTAFVREIRDVLSGVVRGGHTMGGQGLKVFVS